MLMMVEDVEEEGEELGAACKEQSQREERKKEVGGEKGEKGEEEKDWEGGVRRFLECHGDGHVLYQGSLCLSESSVAEPEGGEGG